MTSLPFKIAVSKDRDVFEFNSTLGQLQPDYKTDGFRSQQLTKVIGPHTCLWVFVKGEPGKVYGPFFAIGTPGINLIEDGLLRQFTAQVKCHFHGLSISPKKMTPSPGHLIY